MKEQLLTIDEVAWYLRLSKMTIYRMIQRRDLQAVKIANQWRFRREAVEKWLSDHIPSEEVGPSSLTRSKVTDYEKKYRPAIHEFIHEIIETNPDILALVDRRGARLFSEWEQPPSDYNGLVVSYKALECTPDVDINGRYIALLDDCIQHGTTLAQMRKDLEARGAVVRTFAFIGCESFLSGERELMEPEVRVCMRLPDTEFTRVLAEATEYLLEQGKTQDTDHFVIQLAIRGKKTPPTVQQFLDFLANYGDVFTVPSPAENNGIITITLDHPTYFKFDQKGIPAFIDFSDGVVKTRFYYNVETNTCLCLPIVMPKVRLNSHTYFETDRNDKKLPINLREMGYANDSLLDKQKATCCYRDITTNISVALAEQTIRHLNSKVSPFEVSLADPPINREALEQCYGKTLGGRLADKIVLHLRKNANIQTHIQQGVLFGGRMETEFYTLLSQRVAKKQMQSFFKIMPAVELLTRWYDELKESVADRGQRLTEYGITFSEMYQKLKDRMELWEVSFALDFGLDRTVIAPVHLIESCGPHEWEIRKGYRPGESAPGEPPKVGHGDSKALDPIIFRFRRDKFLLPFILVSLMEHCPSEKNGVEPLLLFKVLACLRLDWLTKEERQTFTFWESTPAEFGPLPEIPRTDSFEDGGNPYHLADSKQAYIICKPKLNPQTGKQTTRRYFMPVEGWHEVIQQYFNGDELSAIDSYLQVYSTLYNRLDVPQSKRSSVDVLLTLSACFSDDYAYKYAHKNLSLWISRFGRFIHLCNEKLIRGKADRIAQTIIECERTAIMAIDKISRFENLQSTEQTIRQVVGSQSSVLLMKRCNEIIGRLEKSSGLSSQLLKLKQMAEMMKAVSTLVKYLFSRTDDFNIKDSRHESEKKHKLDHYVAQAKEKSKGLIQATKFFPAFEIPDDSININILRTLVPRIDELYNGICTSFRYNCQTPDIDARQDPDKLIDKVNQIEKCLAKHNMKNGVFMFTDLDKSTLQFDPLTPIEIVKVIQWYKGPMQDIFTQFGGKIIKLEGDGNFVIFQNESDAVVAGITILQNISQIGKNLNLLPMCIGISKGEYLQSGIGTRNQLGAKINWTSKLAGLDPPGMYVTEDIVKTVNDLKIPASVRTLPDRFAALKQKVFSVQWNLGETKELVK